jgi:SAM-dependent methyltransferase
MTHGYTVVNGCRSCGGTLLELVVDFGQMPLSDALFDPQEDRALEARFPLTLVRCADCGLLQILETVDPAILFGPGYPYYSSVSDELVNNARSNVAGVLARKPLDAGSLVVELASNDGYLLQWFQQAGVPVLGVDPAPGPAATAVERGIPTRQDFFDMNLASEMAGSGIAADVIIGNNVLAHVPDQNALLEAMLKILKPDGAIVMEFPYAADMIEGCEFDTIYHEHHCYFTLETVRSLFAGHGLGVVTADRLSIHGGSLRIWVERDAKPDASVAAMLEYEHGRGIDRFAYYADFAKRVQTLRCDLVRVLHELRSEGNRIAGYGAAAKGAILLNYCGLGADVLDYIVDRNVHKHGLEMPGLPIPIRPVEHLRETTPDYLLLLAWNFRDEIMRQQAWFSDRGGRFIIPVPEPAVV